MEYAEKVAQIKRLQQEADKLKKVETEKAIRTVMSLLETYGLTLEDLKSRSNSKRQKTVKPKKRSSTNQSGRKVAPKYGDGGGNFWTGRGKMPVWLREKMAAGNPIETFLLPIQQ